jgi:hypothetical protein
LASEEALDHRLRIIPTVSIEVADIYVTGRLIEKLRCTPKKSLWFVIPPPFLAISGLSRIADSKNGKNFSK